MIDDVGIGLNQNSHFLMWIMIPESSAPDNIF